MARPLSTDARRTALAHARDILLADGLTALNFEALARHSGVAKTTLYRHWPHLGELLHDTLMDLIQPSPAPNTGALRTDIEMWACNRPDPAVADQARRIFFLLMEASISDPAVREVQAALLEQQTQPIRAMINHAVERGELAPDIDIDLAVDVIIGPMVARTVIRNLETDDDVAAELVNVAIAGLGALGTASP